MQQLDDEVLMAYADGALGPEEARQVRLRLDGDPEARARVALFERTTRLLKDALDPVATEPVPARLNKAVAPRPWRRWRESAMAASVALLMGLGGGWWMAQPGLPSGPPAELVEARQHALETQVSGNMVSWSAPSGEHGTVKPVATWRTPDGRFFREFHQTIVSADGVDVSGGIAERQDGTWKVRYRFRFEESSSTARLVNWG